nr:immunoglobulin heavy chain junction region [Macaca mulatta]
CVRDRPLNGVKWLRDFDYW